MVSQKTIDEVRRVRINQEILEKNNQLKSLSNLSLIEFFEEAIIRDDINQISCIKVEILKRFTNK